MLCQFVLIPKYHFCLVPSHLPHSEPLPTLASFPLIEIMAVRMRLQLPFWFLNLASALILGCLEFTSEFLPHTFHQSVFAIHRVPCGDTAVWPSSAFLDPDKAPKLFMGVLSHMYYRAPLSTNTATTTTTTIP